MTLLLKLVKKACLQVLLREESISNLALAAATKIAAYEAGSEENFQGEVVVVVAFDVTGKTFPFC